MLASALQSLAEIAGAAQTLDEYESAALEVVGARVGFDVAMWKRDGRLGPCRPGLDPAIVSACGSHWSRFAEEILPVVAVAGRQGDVAVDVDVFGMRRMERLEYYQRLMKLHHGTSTAIVCLRRRGEFVASLALGRTRGGFNDGELGYLRALAPTLSLCEAVVRDATGPDAATCSIFRTLTRREREVLGFLHLGYTNGQIALALGSMEKTVRNQLSSIYRKLDVSGRAEAVALAVENGLVSRSH